MRVKRSVDFRMAPKKATKGKGAAAEPTRNKEWNTSKCSQSDLESLVSQGLLVPRSVIQWRPALGSDHPYENTGEIVTFTSYLEGKLVCDTSPNGDFVHNTLHSLKLCTAHSIL